MTADEASSIAKVTPREVVIRVPVLYRPDTPEYRACTAYERDLIRAVYRLLAKSAAGIGRKGRAVNSPAQQRAARENGKRGGRPKGS